MNVDEYVILVLRKALGSTSPRAGFQGYAPHAPGLEHPQVLTRRRCGRRMLLEQVWPCHIAPILVCRSAPWATCTITAVCRRHDSKLDPQ